MSIQGGKISILTLKGVNEREQFNQSDISEFDIVQGLVPTANNTLSKPAGITLYLALGVPIRGICQTGDSRQTIIVQTDRDIRVMSESDLLSIAPTFALTNIALNEEETMSQAVLLHSVASGTNGGALPANNTLSQRPLNDLKQFNPDGTVAAFCSLAANQFTLNAGVYRLEGWSTCAQGNAGGKNYACIWDVTNNVPAFNGLANQNSDVITTVTANVNYKLFLEGVLQPAAPNIYEIRNSTSLGFSSTTCLGNAQAIAAVNEIFAYLRILKTT